MVKKIDASGLACPQPVLITKNALDGIDEGTVEVIVDNKAASENVARFARNAGCNVQIKEEAGQFRIGIEKEKAERKTEKKEKPSIAVFVAADTIGRDNDELGEILIRAFFPTLLETTPKPDKLIFMNSGVKLTAEGSAVLKPLQEIEKTGTEILVCGTCLDFFKLKDKMAVGRISNMFEITSSLLNSDTVLTL